MKRGKYKRTKVENDKAVYIKQPDKVNVRLREAKRQSYKRFGKLN